VALALCRFCNQVTKFLRVVYPIIILNTLSVGMLWPAIPPILEGSFNGDIKAVAILSSKISAVNAVLDFFSNPVLGSLSDTYGRRPFLLQSLCVACASHAFVAAVGTPSAVVVAKIALGLCNVSKAMMYAMIVDVMDATGTSQSARVKVFGLIGVASGCGFALGPALGGFIGYLYSPFVTVAAAAVFVGISAMLVVLTLPETRVQGSGEAASPTAAGTRGLLSVELCSSLQRTAALGKSHGLVWLFGTFVLSGVAAGPYAIWYFYTEMKYGWGYGTNSLFLACYGAASVAAQGVLLPTLTPRVLTEFATVNLGFFANSLVFALYGLLSSSRGSLLFAVLPLSMVGSLSEPVLRHVFSQLVSPQEQGALQGALAALGTFSNAVGPLLAARLLSAGSAQCDSLSSSKRGNDMSNCSNILGAPFFVSSALFVLSAATAALAFSSWSGKKQPTNRVPLQVNDPEKQSLIQTPVDPPQSPGTPPSPEDWQ
jgi:DHA1 family tetracycline resistance protein-like MFS transporter